LADVPFAVKHATAAEVEKEIRAQVERAMKVGIRPTHLDSHMGTLFIPAYFPAYVKVAREYRLPFLAMRTGPMLALLKDTDILPDTIEMATNVNPENWGSYYLGLVRSLKAGPHRIDRPPGLRRCRDASHHRGHPDYGSAWRQRDFDVITSPAFQQALKDNRVTLVGWKTIQAKTKP
jgi:predicted glycoside hydrolase/deacetylase ChbG (UPF0249 family)